MLLHREGRRIASPRSRKSLFASTAIVTLACWLDVCPAAAQSVTVNPARSDVTAPSPVSSPVWTTGGDLSVGNTSDGELTVQDGGVVEVDGTSYVGNDVGSQGTVSVSGQDSGGNASTWTSTGDLVVGQSGTGTLAITGGGKVSNTTGYVGASPGSTSTVVVSGTGSNAAASTWKNGGNLLVGDQGTGTLTIQNGGLVDVDGMLSVGGDGMGSLNIANGGKVISDTGGIGNGAGTGGV
jgi:fibronectin-binding autotransporter adhesin